MTGGGTRPTSGHLAGLLGYRLRRTSDRFMADFIETFADAPLRPAQFSILSLIADNPGISQSELSRELAIKRTNMVPLITELERRDLLTRTPAPADRRVQRLTLTPMAVDQIAAWRKRIDAREAELAKCMTAEERQQLLALLAKL